MMLYVCIYVEALVKRETGEVKKEEGAEIPTRDLRLLLNPVVRKLNTTTEEGAHS